ncbi:MAG: globin [Verrucomicrobiota bacterium]
MEEIVVDSLGEEGFGPLIAAFYRRVREDELVGGMYPSDDWEGAEKRLRDFMDFRFGISQRYILERGHPRLRMRHMPFKIGDAEKDRWLQMMGEAMDEVEISGEPRENLEAFFAQVANFMRNQGPS